MEEKGDTSNETAKKHNMGNTSDAESTRSFSSGVERNTDIALRVSALLHMCWALRRFGCGRVKRN